MPKLGLIIAAGGSSRRYGNGNKLFEMLAGKYVFLHALETLKASCECTVLVAPASDLELFRNILQQRKLGDVIVAAGGAERSDSVLAGLRALPKDVDYVAIQDAARPLTTVKLLDDCYSAALECGAAIAAHRVTDTVKIADSQQYIDSTPDRRLLWAAETPQVFKRSIIEDAYCKCAEKNMPVTDDAQAVQLWGTKVRLVENPSCNVKITHKDDLLIAQAFADR